MKKLRIILMSLAILAICGIADAQETSIVGQVVDAQGATVASASVTAQSASGESYKTTTDKSGNFQFPNLTAADYSVRAEGPGFSPTVEKITLLVGQSLQVTIKLQVASAVSTVEVTSAATTLDTVTSEVAGNVDPETFQKIPLNGRNYMDLSMLLPGIRRNAITNYSPLGSLNNGKEQFNLDSQQVTQNGADSSFGQPQFSRDAISQFQIITNQFDATQGRTSQLTLNLQSKAGSDALHGTAFGYFRNQTFDAADPITKTVLPFSDQQYGGSLGGPIVKNKLWYFGSYEGEHRPQTTNTTLIDFGTPAPSFGYSDTLLNNEYLFRGDYQPRSQDHIFVRYFYFDTGQPDLLPSGSSSISRQYKDTLDNWGYIGSWSHTVTSNFVNSIFAGRFYNVGINTPIVPSMQLTFPTQVVGAAYNYPSDLPTDVIQFRDDSYWLKAKHSFKFGEEVLLEYNDGSFPQNERGTVAFSADPPLGYAATFPNQLDPSTWNYASISPYVTTYTQGFGQFNTNIHRKQIGLWIQDDWKVIRQLTLNLGIRYDNDVNVFTPAAVDINGVQGPTHGDNFNFGPRFGFAWDVFGAGKTVVRGGIGMFYADMQANQTIDAQIFNGVTTVQAAAPISNPTGNAAIDTVTGQPFSLTNPFAGENTGNFIQSPGSVFQAIQVMEPSPRTPWSGQSSIGVQQEFGYGLSASADYTYMHFHHDWTRQDANLVEDPTTGWAKDNYGPVTAACPFTCITSRYNPNPHYSTIATFYTPNYIGSFMQNILVNIQERTRYGASGGLSYTYGTEKDNSASAFSYPSNQFNYQDEWAPSVDDQRHTLTIHADYEAKYGLHGGILYHYGSGLAYGPSVGTPDPVAVTLDSNRSFCLEPAGWKAGTTLPGTICSHLSNTGASYTKAVYNSLIHDHYDSVTGLTTVDRDSFRGLPNERVDANLSKTTAIHEKYRITTTIEAFNLLNHSNYGSYNTVITNSTYGLPTSTSGVLAFYARQLQFSARLDF